MSLLPDRPRHSFLPSRSLNGRMASDSHPRFGSSSSSFRSKPYDKPYSPPARIASDSRWSHDLFEDDSNLYGPKVRFQANPLNLINFGAPRPSPSLRPFGNAAVPSTAAATTSLPVSSIKTTTPSPVTPVVLSQRPPVKNPQPAPVNSNSGISLLSRIQSSDTQKPILNSDSSSNVRRSSSTANPQPWKLSDASQINRSDQAAHQEIKTHQILNAKNHQALYDEAMARYLNGPVILEVANLADGTSAEDVKTAFADFGDIQECSTEEGLRQANQPTLKAKIIFTHKAEAEKAVEALNGALADGLTLAVKIIGRPTKKPERADFMTTSQVDTRPSKPMPDTPMQSSDNDITMEDGESPIVPTGRLRSEVVAQCDPRASIQVEPRPAAIYQVEQPKPAKSIIPNMLSRVQPLSHSSTQPVSFSVHHHHRQHPQALVSGHRGTFGQIHPANHPQFHHLPKRPQEHNHNSNSLLARIKPI